MARSPHLALAGLLSLSPLLAVAEEIVSLGTADFTFDNHPAAEFCDANPSDCTCAVTGEQAFTDTPEAQPFIDACVSRLVEARGHWSNCSGKTVSWRPALRRVQKQKIAEADCNCMARKQPPKRRCERWAGVNEDFGAAQPRHPWFKWAVRAGASEGLLDLSIDWACVHAGIPGAPACVFEGINDSWAAKVLVPVAMGHWRRADTAAPTPAPDSATWRNDPDNANDNETSYGGGRFLRVGEWILFGSGGQPGWARGSFSWERVDGAAVSRRTGTWTYWNEPSIDEPSGAVWEWHPTASGRLEPVGPRRRSLRQGKWLEKAPEQETTFEVT